MQGDTSSLTSGSVFTISSKVLQEQGLEQSLVVPSDKHIPCFDEEQHRLAQ